MTGIVSDEEISRQISEYNSILRKVFGLKMGRGNCCLILFCNRDPTDFPMMPPIFSTIGREPKEMLSDLVKAINERSEYHAITSPDGKYILPKFSSPEELRLKLMLMGVKL